MSKKKPIDEVQARLVIETLLRSQFASEIDSKQFKFDRRLPELTANALQDVLENLEFHENNQ